MTRARNTPETFPANGAKPHTPEGEAVDVNSHLLTIIGNTRTWQAQYHAMVRAAQLTAACDPLTEISDEETAARILLTDALKDRVLAMVDDVGFRHDPAFPRGPLSKTDGPHIQRSEFLKALIQEGLSRVNFAALARDLIADEASIATGR